MIFPLSFAFYDLTIDRWWNRITLSSDLTKEEEIKRKFPKRRNKRITIKKNIHNSRDHACYSYVRRTDEVNWFDIESVPFAQNIIVGGCIDEYYGFFCVSSGIINQSKLHVSLQNIFAIEHTTDRISATTGQSTYLGFSMGAIQFVRIWMETICIRREMNIIYSYLLFPWGDTRWNNIIIIVRCSFGQVYSAIHSLPLSLRHLDIFLLYYKLMDVTANT